MNPLLLEQIIQLITWGVTGLLNLKENDAFLGQMIPALKLALSENRPLTDEEWQPIHDAAQQAHDELRDA